MTNLSIESKAAGGSSMSFLIMMVVIFAIMVWFFIKFRPQQKKQKEIRKFQNALAEGTRRWLQAAVFTAQLSVLNLEACNTVDVESSSWRGNHCS